MASSASPASTTLSGAGAVVNPTSGILGLLGGVTDSGNGLGKIGAGILILGPSAGTFTGPLSIVQGTLQPLAANSLTTGATTIGSAVAVAGAPLTTATSFTLPSVAGLFVGQAVTSTGGTGSFAANTVITAINTSHQYGHGQ